MRDVLAPDEGEQPVLGERQNTCHLGDDDLLQPGLLKHPVNLVVEHGKIQRDHDVDLAVLDLACDFALGIERVEVDDRAAGLQDAIVADDEIRCVGQEQSDLRALAHAERLEAAGRSVHQRADFGIGVAFVHEIDAGTVGKLLDGFLHQAVERSRRNLGMPIDIGRIAAFPEVRAKSGCRFRHSIAPSPAFAPSPALLLSSAFAHCPARHHPCRLSAELQIGAS